MSTITIPYDDASIGTYYPFSGQGGLPTHLVTKFKCHGNSLIAKLNMGSTGSYTYYVDGTEYTIDDPTFSNNVLTELFSHGESDGDHVVYIPGNAGYVATTNSYKITSAGAASFAVPDDWGEFAAITANPSAGSTTSFPAYVTNDNGHQHASASGTYGVYAPRQGTSFRWVGTGSSIHLVGLILSSGKDGKIVLFKDGVSHATFDLGASSLVTDARRLHRIFTGLDAATEHEWCLYFACSSFSIAAIQMGGATPGTFNHSPTFAYRPRALIISDSTATPLGTLADQTEVWDWLVFTPHYWVLMSAGIAGTTLRDYTGDGAPHNAEVSHTTDSGEYRVEHTYKSFTAGSLDAVVLSMDTNDSCSAGNLTTSTNAIIDDMATAFPAAKIIIQQGQEGPTYDTALANSITYGTGAYPGTTIRTGTRAAGISHQIDGLHADAAGMVTIANAFAAEQADLFSTGPTVSSPTATSVTKDGCVLNATTDDDTGSIDYVILPDGATAPDGDQIVAGTDGDDNPAIEADSNGSLVVGTNVIATITGRSEGTVYDVYMVQDTGSGLSNVVSTTFTTLANAGPSTPTITAGTPGATSVFLAGSAFSDPDVGDTHASSQWQVTETADTLYATPVLDTGVDTVNKTGRTATGLTPETVYRARVRYRDNNGNYSSYATSVTFTTAAASTSTNTQRRIGISLGLGL